MLFGMRASHALLAIGTLLLTVVSSNAQSIDVRIDVAAAGKLASTRLTASCIEDVNHEIYGGLYSQMVFGESFQEPPREEAAGVSGMWSPLERGGTLAANIEYERPFVGTQSQRITLAGAGEAGILNRGLKRWGLSLVEAREYDGCVWIRSTQPTDVTVAFTSRDGSKRYATASLAVGGKDQWQRYDFKLTPSAADADAAFAILLTSPGSIVVGHAFCEPGEWGRFKGLPIRKDVADAMVDQGITALRYGGSMVNEPEYRWKKMIGPRDQRPPYAGRWYRQSSNGFGIIDFLNFCDAAAIDGTPSFCMDESAKDMLDFVDYAIGGPDTEWGKRRAAEGHPEPYALKQIELGNEERVDDHYFERFEKIANAIWAKYPKLVLVVGDFNYNDPITDPMHFTGADSKITSLAAQQKVMALAKQHDAEVWFDVHINTENPPQAKQFLAALQTYIDAIDSLAGGAKHHVNVFELNSNRHDQNRALSNAIAIGALQRDGRLPMVISANGLQPDGQNDNGWDQGLIFFNPSKVWLQPPAYVARMITQSYEPITLDAQTAGDLDVTACRSEDGKTVVLRLVNPTDRPISTSLHLDHFVPAKPTATRWELSGARDAQNTAGEPTSIVPRESMWTHQFSNGVAACELPPRSFTVLRLE